MQSSALLAITTSLVIVTSGLAQEQKAPTVQIEPGVGQMGGGIGQIGLGVGVDPQLYTKSALLKIPGILEELKVTDEQKDKLKEADRQLKLDLVRIYKQIQGEKSQLKQQCEPEVDQAFRKQTLAYAGRLTRDFERPMLKLLDRNQIKRLEQIQIRADGYMAFSIADVIDRLGLTPDQEAEIAVCVSVGRKNVQMAASPYRRASTESARLPEDQKKAQLASEAFQTTASKAQSAVIEARSATLREIRKVLTNSQQATFKNMAGPPFDFDKLNPIKTTKSTVASPVRPEAN